MTRLLCTGDLHLRDDRLDDQEHMLEQIVDVARDREVDGVLIAGDVFDRPKPSPTELHAFARFARRLERAAIPAVAVLGNAGHDQLGADLPSALELFAHGDWLRVSRHPEVIQVGGVAVCTLPSAPPSRLIAKLGGRDDVTELAVAFLLDAARELRAQVVDGPAGPTPAVLLGHWAVSGASLPNGLPTSDLHEPVLPLDALEAIGFDAMIFGHIHKAQQLATDPEEPYCPAFYTGSPMCLNFGEAAVEHGVWVLEVGDGIKTPLVAEFVPLEGRRFVTVDADLTRPPLEFAPDATDAVAAAIAEQLPIVDAVIRIRYRATEEQARRVDVQALKDFCLDAGAHRVYQVTPELVRVTRARVAGVDESLAPKAAVDAWCSANDVDETPRRYLGELVDAYAEAAA